MQESGEVLAHTVGKWEPTDNAAELLGAQGVPRAVGCQAGSVLEDPYAEEKPELSHMEMRKASGS